jgi:hypothetical protein
VWLGSRSGMVYGVGGLIITVLIIVILLRVLGLV